jgi:4-aminobutyrate--pyruvate transaminase
MVNSKVHNVLVDQSLKLGTFAHGFTYSGHPVSSAVAIETLKIMDERNIVQHVRDLSPLFAEHVKKFADRKYVGDTRSVGFLGGIELVADKSKKPGTPFDPKLACGPKFVTVAQKHGIVVRVVGLRLGELVVGIATDFTYSLRFPDHGHHWCLPSSDHHRR